ncbi:DUF4157 domain-containing protein [Streptomyces sp. APSN-46.1]|uniref:eCIS core domain-containing protein n=1 Tax=Streptomyces sp. APSN-46.1 TaxID=2929049 RepID=UPI001FB37568|nr:DUF4157 domain-containing protein [Streptomyces sp. APSN-46.1]MCJ1676900.1 DUF4157 domain-containing protein [Streptomyces sp. APSN-46.1]
MDSDPRSERGTPMAEAVRQSDVRTGARRERPAPSKSKAKARDATRPLEAAPGPARLVAHGAGNRAVGAYLRREARRAEGQALDPSLRAEMESHLGGADLSGVRLHTSAAAAESANALRARAFTVGQDIVFASGEYHPADRAGRALIAHELTHTVQQTRGGPGPAGSDRTERTAAESAARLTRGSRGARVTEGSAVGVARQPAGAQTAAQAPEKQKPDSLGFWGDLLIDELAGVAVGSGLQQQMLKAAVIGFIAELDRQVQDPKSRADIQAGAKELAKRGNQEKMIAAYYAGTVAGVVSPVTDLLGLVVLAEQLRAFTEKLVVGALKGEGDLIGEVTGLIEAYDAFKKSLLDSLIDIIKNHPEELFFFGHLQAVAVRTAGEAGRTGARKVVAAISDKDEGKPAKPPETAWQILTTATEAEKAGGASTVTSMATRARQAIFHTHPERLGYDVGEAVGAVVGNLLVALFTEGVGSAVTKIAGEIGRVAPILARGAEALAEIGKGIAAVEKAVGALIEGALSASLKGLSRIFKPFRELMTRLRDFLTKLLGKASQLEAAAVHTAETAAPKVAPSLAPNVRKLPGPGEPRPKRSALTKKQQAALEKKAARAQPAAPPEPHPQSGAVPVAEEVGEVVEPKIAAGAEGFEPAPGAAPPTAAAKAPQKGSPPLKAVPPPKGTVAPAKPKTPKAAPPPKRTKAPAKKQAAAAPAADVAKRAKVRATEFKLASQNGRLTGQLTPVERSLITDHIGERQPLIDAMKNRLREDARVTWKKATQGIGRQPGPDYQVHHIIPLEFAHRFPARFPNDPRNLVLMKTNAHRWWHTMINAKRGRLSPKELRQIELRTIPYNEGDVFIVNPQGRVIPAR